MYKGNDNRQKKNQLFFVDSPVVIPPKSFNGLKLGAWNKLKYDGLYRCLIDEYTTDS